MKKILITGGAGYIGSVLTTLLVEEGYSVTVVDNLLYFQDPLSHLLIKKNFTFIKMDTLNFRKLKKLVKKNEIIIPLAAYVGAPLCDKYPRLAKSVNYNSIKYLLSILRKDQKIIYPNTNSGYGITKKNIFCTEETPLSPISLYGTTKCAAESEVIKFDNSVCLRLATVFGVSYRMRSDLLVNNFVMNSVYNKRLNIFEGNFRRNYIHVRDVANAFYYIIKNFNKMKGNIFNLGLSDANLTKIDLAIKIKKYIPKLKIKKIKGLKDIDKRDYYVSNKKIEKAGFRTKITLDDGIKELINFFLNSTSKFINNY
jgi:nucleoside-diphosphate-sugar epimerase